MGDKFLSEVLSLEQLQNELSQNNNKVCILSGVGSGKNFFIENILTESIDENIFYVTSRRAKVNEIKRDENFSENIFDSDILNQHKFVTTNYGVESLLKVSAFNDIIKKFDYFVIDECHSLFSDATFADSSFHLLNFIENITDNFPNKKVIMMTGTPEPINKYLDRKKWKVLNYLDECINVLPKKIQIIDTKSINKIINHSLQECQKIIYMTNSASYLYDGDCIKNILENVKLTEFNEDNIAICISKFKKSKLNKYDQEKMEKISESLINNNRFPDDIDLLLCTSCLKEGINIDDERVKIGFCESHLMSDIQQFMGRVRTQLDCLYIIDDATQNQQNINLYNFRIESKFVNDYLLKSSDSYIQDIINKKEINNLDYFFKEDCSIYSTNNEAKYFIDEVIEKRFKYVRFNPINDKFMFYGNKFYEEIRLTLYYIKNKDKDDNNYIDKTFENSLYYKHHEFFSSYEPTEYAKRISKFCNANGIKFLNNFSDEQVKRKKDNFIKSLNNILNAPKNKIGFFKDDKKFFYSKIYEFFNEKFNEQGQLTKVNDLFEDNEIPIRLIKCRKNNYNGIKLIEFIEEIEFNEDIEFIEEIEFNEEIN